MLLVVDVSKGFQTQTAECLIIGELTCEALVVALNKIDLLPPDKREERIAKVCCAGNRDFSSYAQSEIYFPS